MQAGKQEMITLQRRDIQVKSTTKGNKSDHIYIYVYISITLAYERLQTKQNDILP